jgi:glycerate 2-kinase
VFASSLFAGRPNSALRRAAADILAAAVAAVDPGAAVQRHVAVRGNVLRAGEGRYDLRAVRRIFVVGTGKASAPMAASLEALLDDRITGGMVTVKYGHAAPLRRIRLVEASHPLPDASGQRGAEEILALVQSAAAGDLVIAVVSGGGSALLPAPAPGLTLQDKIQVTDLLLRSGATIQEINTVRRHLSQIKGGRLAQAAAPAKMLVLILSDVLGNPPDAIASGPASPDPTTFADALAIVRRYALLDRIPPAARDHLMRGAAGAVPDTPKPGDPIFRRVQTVIVGSNELALHAAQARARALGFRPLLLTSFLEGEAREAARALCSIARSVRVNAMPLGPPACLLAGGETTVTVRGSGRGGRCQEFALSAGIAAEGWADAVVAAFGTDGTDGPTDAAGAIADGTTVTRARALGLDPAQALAQHDAYPFFQALGDLLVCGPTRTNVNDIYLSLIGLPRRKSRKNKRKSR